MKVLAPINENEDAVDKKYVDDSIKNGTLTIQKNGTTVQTFTANQSSNVTANIAVPTKTSDLTNDSGYTTNTGTVTSVTVKGTSPIAVNSESAITTSGTRTISHANSGVTAGTYRSVTVNATGHVTAGTNPTTLSGYGITDATSTTVLPNDAGEIKTRYRIAKKDYTGSGNTVWYYPICELPTDNSGNYASVIISGRIGGWVNTNMSSITALAWNRGGDGIALLDIAGGATSMSSIWGICDIVLYRDSSNKTKVYLKCVSYFTFDLDFEFFQSGITILYDGTYITTTPSGTLSTQASTSTKRAELYNGKLYIAGTQLAFSSTTLSGYGITDAKIASGVITLGSNTITPLTASSTLDATKLSGTIPSGCYTDTKNTAGSTDSSSKLFLVGATSQAANPQTYSQDTVYAGTDGHLYSNSKQAVNLSDTQDLTNKTYEGYTLAAACGKDVDDIIEAGGSTNVTTSAAVVDYLASNGYGPTNVYVGTQTPASPDIVLWMNPNNPMVAKNGLYVGNKIYLEGAPLFWYEEY